MRLTFLFAFLFLSKLLLAQDDKMVADINRMIGPQFTEDTINYKVVDISKKLQEGNKTAVIIAVDTNSDGLSLYKIFILKKIDERLKIVDTSARYMQGGSIRSLHDTLQIMQRFSGGAYIFDYKFDNERQKYLLVNMEYAYPKGGIENDYEINKQELTVSKLNSHDKWISKTSKQPLPKNFIPDLAHFIAPEGYDDRANIYDTIFMLN